MATRKKADEAALSAPLAVQRPPAEVQYAEELTRLRADDEREQAPRPPGWALSMTAVRRFILGDEQAGLTPKFVGNPSLVDRAMVTLATNRGLLLVGEPGTAKSLLSELIAAAVRGPRRSPSRAGRHSPRTRSSTAGTTRCWSPRGRPRGRWCRRRSTAG